MINVLIFSKDRACQLDLTLTTMKKYFREWSEQKYTIIYKYSTDRYRLGYERIKTIHPEFNWVLETDFRGNTVATFNNGGRPYSSFLVDDDVFVDYFSLDSPEFKAFQSNPNILCVSPRLAPYINYCYTQNAPQPQPPFFSERSWEWQGKPGDWGYPMSIASFHIFRTEDLYNPINTIYFPAPSYLEGTCLAAKPPTNRPLMICFETAKCICSTNNRVQNVNGNRHENSDPLDYLNETFLSGKRLSPDVNHQIKMNMCHGPLKYIFI